MLYTYSILPLNEERIDEICADAIEQYKRNVSTCPLFCFTLHAEGKPPIDKAKIQCEIFDKFRDRLEKAGVPCGILAQSTIGHGYALDEGIAFSPYVELTTGEETSVACPDDPEWLEYIKNAMAELARHRPKAIMLDDDCRLLNRPGRGCACPRHLAEFNRRAGTDMTRKELADHIFSHPDDDRLTKIFLDVQRASIKNAMIAMREGVDSVDPTIQGINCLTHRTCEIVTDAWNIFSGKGNPVIVRIPNGSYAPTEVRRFSDLMLRSAATVAALKGKADIILAETDTIPFNRYGKSAVYLKGHFASAMLDGCSGAKHWITRLRAYEPESGVEFRNVLSKNAAFFEEIFRISKEFRPVGACVPFAPSFYRYGRDPWTICDADFAECVLERMGVPFFFSDEVQKSVWINGNGADDIPDQTMKKLFRGCVCLSSDAAKKLIERGFGDEIGVEVRPYDGLPVTGELFPDGNTADTQVGTMEIVPENENVRALSFAYHLKGGKDKIPLFPAVAEFVKPDGSVTVTFSGTPKAKFDYTEAFSFLNATRKKQIVSVLKKANVLPVWSDTDAEVLMRAGWLADGSLIVASWNLGWDVIGEYPLVTEKPIKKVEILTSNGTWNAVDFSSDGEKTTVKTELRPVDPVFLRLSFAK